MSGYVYRCQWPITDESLTTRELSEEALPDLRASIAATGAYEIGPPRWGLGLAPDGSSTLVVSVPCAMRPNHRRSDEFDIAIAHLLDEGVSTHYIALMIDRPLAEVELAALRVRHVRADPVGAVLYGAA